MPEKGGGLRKSHTWRVGREEAGEFQEIVAYHTLKKETTVKKTMKWTLRVVLSLALFAGFAALDVRPSWAVSTDVFDADSRLYVPYWRADASAFTILIVENVSGPGSTAVIRFYDKNCNFVKDFHPDLTTDDVDFLDVNAIMSPLSPATAEGGLIITTDAFGGSGGAAMTAETIVVNGVDGSVIRFHHINEDDSGFWNVFENFWTGSYFDATTVDNELYLFCPKKKAATPPGPNLMGDDLLTLAASPVGSATAFSTGVDISFFDDHEALLVTQPLLCTCVTRVLLHSLTSAVVGTSGRIEITSQFAGGDSEDFIAYMKRQVRGTPFLVDGYMFSN